MSFDMTQFRQVFFDEAAEHLGTLESVLLRLDVQAPDPEDLNAIFRAAHSIKGGAGTFGFGDVTELTHVAETLLDRLRRGELAPTTTMVDALLEATDVIRALLLAHQTGSAGEAAIAEASKVRLEALTSPGVAGATAAGSVPVPPGARLLLRFRAPEEGEAIENLLAELRGLGALTVVKRAKARRRARSGGGTQWEVLLDTAADEQAVRELFEFVLAPEDLEVEALAAPGPGDAAAVSPGREAFTGDDPGFGFFDPPDTNAPDASPVGTAPGHDGTAEGLAPVAGRRASDLGEFVEARAGRRAGDRVLAGVEAASIRVSTEKVDQLINLVGELVITQSMLAQAITTAEARTHAALLQGIAQLERNSRDLQEAVMSIRMMPVGFVFNRFPRMVRDLAAKLGKRVELQTVGEQTELDKGVIEKIADPLTHLVRNALDHGIEPPGERLACGKPEAGTLTLRAFHQGGNIVIEVRDDGRGIDRARILAKARERGMTMSDDLPDNDVFALIFEPGFSTAAAVTDVSGRGVGMDVVRKNIEALGGRVEVASRPGEGSCISIRLPLTLAILDGLSVSVADQLYIVPLSFIVESLQACPSDVRSVGGAGRVLHVRGEYLPVLCLQDAMGARPTGARLEDGIMVILEAEGQRAAMFVDALVGQHQVVIKSLEGNYRKVPGISAATIMGDGTVAMILDVAELVARATGRQEFARAA
jgi:two-component system chemotaxis sensor kinase CheA